MKRNSWLAGVLVAVSMVAVACSGGPFASGTATPPSVDPAIVADTGDPVLARKQLGELAVKPRGSMAGYSREKFPHWSTVEGTCDTREAVLKRDGTNVTVDAQCKAVSGTWLSRYDGATWTQAGDLDIDHWVPLAEAWRSGASAWTQEKRALFANDMTRRQLIAVTDNVNQSKGDQPPDQWKPPLAAYWCTYSVNWIGVKHYYQLSITLAEQAALTSMVDRCGTA